MLGSVLGPFLVQRRYSVFVEGVSIVAPSLFWAVPGTEIIVFLDWMAQGHRQPSRWITNDHSEPSLLGAQVILARARLESGG